jgi:hypothetical protein
MTRRTPKRAASRKVARKPSRKIPRRRAAPTPRKKPESKVRFPRAPVRAAGAAKRPSLFARLIAPRKPVVKPPFQAYRGTKPYLFASYSHRNMREVFGIIRKISDNRFRVWYDEGIEPGNEWPEEVGRALTACRLFLVFMSPEAMESRNVRNEINMATSENKAVMVVFLQPTELSEGMKLQLGTVQFLNRHEMTDAEFGAKLEQVLDPALRG